MLHAFHPSVFSETLSSRISPLADAIGQVSNSGVHAAVFGPINRIDLGEILGIVLCTLIASGLVAYLLRRQLRNSGGATAWRNHLVRAVRGPILLLIGMAGLYVAVASVALKLFHTAALAPLQVSGNKIFSVVVFIAIVWLFFRLTHALEAGMTPWKAKNRNMFTELLVPMIGKPLRILLPVLAVILGIPLLGLPPEYAAIAAKVSGILLIVAMGFIFVQIVISGEQFVLMKYNIHAADNLRARKIYTQVQILGKTLYFIISVFVIASILMLFREVRQFGTSILASAGVIGIIVGFAAQKTIANLFAGFQLALAQPIRLDDVVIVDGEWGNIEEITLTYVVVKIWDQRRLIVPLSYFIDKPFQNWTHSTSQLMGAVLVWVDYSLPLDAARAALKEIIENHPLWDKRFWNLQVTKAAEQAMQIRVLATSADSSQLWTLRCDIREKFIVFIQKNYPQCMPRFRAEISDTETTVPLPT